MIYRIADLMVEIPAAGGIAPRCLGYLTDEQGKADITIHDELYNVKQYPNLSEEDNVYLQSGFQFYRQLLAFDGMMLHASAVALDGKAYLFSGPCGVGKSTHTNLWCSHFGDKVKLFNDDKPALRRIDGRWYAYGTPWCGKNGININMKVPLAGICFLKQSDKNEIQRLDSKTALAKVLAQTTYRLKDPLQMQQMLTIVESLIKEIPIYQLCNKPETAAAELSYRVMNKGSEEVNL